MTLKEFIERELASYGEKWEDIVYQHLTEEQLSRDVYSIPEHLQHLEMDFTIWTKDHVYTCLGVIGHDFDEGWNLVQISRNPPEMDVIENEK